MRVPQETYVYAIRDLSVCQKRPMCMPKETYVHVKRDLCVWRRGLHPAGLSHPKSETMNQRKVWDFEVRQKNKTKKNKQEMTANNGWQQSKDVYVQISHKKLNWS